MTEHSRRDLLKSSAALVLAPGVFLFAPAAAAEEEEMRAPAHRWGLLIDTSRCAEGCTACADACAAEHGIATPEARWLRPVTLRNKVTGDQKTIPVMCQHCAKPPCVAACPTGASHKRPDGIVLVEADACIGCRACLPACPYGARTMAWQPVTDAPAHSTRRQGTAEGCTLCAHRIDAGGRPACTEACPEGAIRFGDLLDPTSDIARAVAEFSTRALRADLLLDTSVRYRGI